MTIDIPDEIIAQVELIRQKGTGVVKPPIAKVIGFLLDELKEEPNDQS